MTKQELEELFALARKMYKEKQRNSGMVSPIPYCFAENKETGELLVFSCFRDSSRKIKGLLYKNVTQ